MKILIYGAGAVGGYLGASLAHIGHAVTFVARPRTAEMLRTHGVSIIKKSGSFQEHPDIVTSIDEAFADGRAYDAVLLGMKSYDVPAAVSALAAVCPTPPLLIALQNGIGVEEQIQQQFPQTTIIAGSVTIPLNRTDTNTIVVERENRGLGLAGVTADDDLVREWVASFETAGVPTVFVADHKAMKWSKALLNIIANASSAILNQHPAQIYQHNPTFDMEMAMLKEAMAVMKQLQIPIVNLPGASATRLAFAVQWLPRFLAHPILAKKVAKGRGNKWPSFHVDLWASGRERSEVIYHNGAIAAQGKAIGVPTPVNETLNRLLCALANGSIDKRDYENAPEKLLLEIANARRK